MLTSLGRHMRLARTLRHASFGIKYATGTKNKEISVEDAVKLIRPGDTITVGGFVAQGGPEEVLLALGKRYGETGQPNDLTLVFTGGPGDTATKGLNHLARPGMLKKTVGSHYGQMPMVGELALNNKIQAYNLPMGTVSRLLRATASNQPGYMTHVGFRTFVDPRYGGGRINEVTTQEIAEIITVGEQEYLYYKAMPINVAIIRGTTADCNGNITMERESLYCDSLNMAMAARSSGGLVICQVERMAAENSLNPRHVRVPGTLVDAIVVARPENHRMSYFTDYNPGWSGEIRPPPPKKRMILDERKIIARRGALQLLPYQVVNLGIGMPEGVAAVADEEHILKYVSLTTEPGTHGGSGASGHDFGPAVNYDGMLELNQQFDFYNGGGLDTCFLGNAQTTTEGNVNVTRVGKKLTGPGGFIDISQSTKRVNLLGTFTAGGLKVETGNGFLKIVEEGKIKKFVKSISEITFSGAQAIASGQIVNYITERCVFTLTKEGLELVEVAPGIDISRDILAQMEFRPIMRRPPRPMRRSIFKDDLMGLREALFSLKMSNRLHYDDSSNTLFIDMSMTAVNSKVDIDRVCAAIRNIFETVIMKKAHVEVNYDGFEANNEIRDQFHAAAEELAAEWYLSVRRHVGRTFRHAKAQKPMQAIQKDDVDFLEAYSYITRHGISGSDRESLQNMFHIHDMDQDGKLSREQFSRFLQRLREEHK